MYVYIDIFNFSNIAPTKLRVPNVNREQIYYQI